jgi:hypothetical protein
MITAACSSEFIWYFQRDEGLTHVGGVLGTLGENTLVLAMVALVALLPARTRVPAVADPPGEHTATLAAD